MNIHLREMIMEFKRGSDTIPFEELNFFSGKMGTGKSSIARLIDFCLGGGFELTPVLQTEFVSVTLKLDVNDVRLTLFRQRDAQQILASWAEYQVVVPVKASQGEVLPGTGVEVLSDLIFYLAELTSPRVRRSKVNEESGLERLSLRDLLWYCYLDQDEIDSNFFNLDPEASHFKRLKSRDVLRYIVGFHQQKVAELEGLLEDVRQRRIQLAEGASALRGALKAAGVESEEGISNRVEELRALQASLASQVADLRQADAKTVTHAVEQLRTEARRIGGSMEQVNQASSDIKRAIDQSERHRNEIKVLIVKFQRATAARAVLNGVTFDACPRCAQTLPVHQASHCEVCGQPEPEPESQNEEIEQAKEDAAARLSELNESIALQQEERGKLERQIALLQTEKQQVDSRITGALLNYDSPVLSRLLELEYQRASAEQESRQLEKLRYLPAKAVEMQEKAESLQAREASVRKELKEARDAAERDTSNLRLLENLFLDCLVRAKIPGVTTESSVSIKSPDFLPQVESGADLVVDSFSNMGSGGKKTLFKCCFALAIHRLAVEISANLPTLLIIDTPMKNISSQENPEQFEGFYELVYDLASDELKDTQFILIDNEYYPPSPNHPTAMYVRHLTLDNPEEPPLVPYRREGSSTTQEKSS